MSGVRVLDLAYCRLRLPDLDLSEQFLSDFGLASAARDTADGRERRYYRGSDPSPYCYVAEAGERRFLGFAFHARSREDLSTLAAEHAVAIEAIDAPGGGERVRLREPNGYDVDVVFGIAPVAAIPVERQLLNSGAEPLRRAGELYRLKRDETPPVKRLAHVVLGTPKVEETRDWFRRVLGMVVSDDLLAGPERALFGSFMRIDDGENFVDHHTLFLISNPVAGLHHLSFEVQDVDAVLSEHHRLKKLGRYDHAWGVGRHLLGSQIFDYWFSPFDYLHEHWADSDRLNASMAPQAWDVREGMVTQWGDEPPVRVREAVRP